MKEGDGRWHPFFFCHEREKEGTRNEYTLFLFLLLCIIICKLQDELSVLSFLSIPIEDAIRSSLPLALSNQGAICLVDICGAFSTLARFAYCSHSSTVANCNISTL